MRACAVFGLICGIAVCLLGCKDIERSGTAELRLNGGAHAMKEVELLIEVNPSIGQARKMNTIVSGTPQPIRYLLKTKPWPELENNQGFAIGWWMSGDDPLGSLKSITGQELTNDPSGTTEMVAKFRIAGKSYRSHDEHLSWIRIGDVAEGTVSGTFGGSFEIEKELTIENMGSEPTIVAMEEGQFKAPIRKFYEQK